MISYCFSFPFAFVFSLELFRYLSQWVRNFDYKTMEKADAQEVIQSLLILSHKFSNMFPKGLEFISCFFFLVSLFFRNGSSLEMYRAVGQGEFHLFFELHHRTRHS